MNERIIRLQPKGKQRKIELFDFEKDTNIFVDVHRESYGNDIKGYFVRYPRGAKIIVTNSLPTREQASIIKRLVKGANACIESVIGMIDGEDIYKCDCTFCLNLEI